MHRRFGDAIHIDQGGSVIRVALIPTVESPGVQRFATKDHVTQGETPSEFRTLPIRLQQLIERRRSLIENGDALARHQHQKFWRGAADRIRYDHQTTTVEKRAPNFPDGKVEGEGMIPARVAKELHRSRTWTSDWLARYRKEGINGLENRPETYLIKNK